MLYNKGRVSSTVGLVEQRLTAARKKERFEDIASWLALIFIRTTTDVSEGGTLLLSGKLQKSSPAFPV